MTEAQSPATPEYQSTPPAPVSDLPIPQQPIAAPGSRYYRSRRYIIAVALLAFAAFFAYDGWKRYPEKNARIDQVQAEINSLTGSTKPDDQKRLADLGVESKSLGAKKSDFDILLQKILAIVLPFLALGFLAFILHRSRGFVRLEADTLHVPGHPPVSLEAITAVDGRLWKKKGIAYIDYAVGEEKGRSKLDAFIYEPKPMDDIYEVVARRFGVWESTRPDVKSTP